MKVLWQNKICPCHYFYIWGINFIGCESQERNNSKMTWIVQVKSSFSPMSDICILMKSTSGLCRSQSTSNVISFEFKIRTPLPGAGGWCSTVLPHYQSILIILKAITIVIFNNNISFNKNKENLRKQGYT